MRYIISIALASALATAASAEVPRVVTDFAPVQSLVQQVMGDLGQPAMILPAGGDPHDFQMKPSQASSLADAQVIFWVGPELMPALGDAIGTLGGKATVVGLLRDGGGHVRQFADGEGTDPHAWLDPENAIAWLGTISATLSSADPEHAAIYRANADQAVTSIQMLDADLTALLAPVKTKPFIVFHDALGYFGDHYGLNIAGAIELGDATTPGAAQLQKIRDLVADSGAICVFPEAGRDPKFIATIIDDKARVGAPQDVEALTLTGGPELYATLLRNLGQSISDCLAKD